MLNRIQLMILIFFWKFFNHSFNVSSCDWSIHLFYFFLLQSGIKFFIFSLHKTIFTGNELVITKI